MNNQIPLIPITGANIPIQLTPTTSANVDHSSTGQLNGRNVTVGSDSGTDQQNKRALIEEVLPPDLFLKIHTFLLAKDNIAFGLTSKDQLNFLNSNKDKLMFAKAEMACQIGLFNVVPKMKQVPSLLIDRIQGCSSFLQSYKDAQFQLADIMSDLKAFKFLQPILKSKLIKDFPHLAHVASILDDLKGCTKSVVSKERLFFQYFGRWNLCSRMRSNL